MPFTFIISGAIASAAVLLFSRYRRRAKRQRYLKQLKAALEFADLRTAKSRPSG